MTLSTLTICFCFQVRFHQTFTPKSYFSAALLSEKTIPAESMRVTSSLLLASLFLLLLPYAEMKRPGKGRGLKGARHKLTRNRYGSTHVLGLIYSMQISTSSNEHVNTVISHEFTLSGWEVLGVTADRAPPGFLHLSAQSWQNLETSL